MNTMKSWQGKKKRQAAGDSPRVPLILREQRRETTLLISPLFPNLWLAQAPKI